jgi:hypothetical protein
VSCGSSVGNHLNHPRACVPVRARACARACACVCARAIGGGGGGGDGGGSNYLIDGRLNSANLPPLLHTLRPIG